MSISYVHDKGQQTNFMTRVIVGHTRTSYWRVGDQSQLASHTASTVMYFYEHCQSFPLPPRLPPCRKATTRRRKPAKSSTAAISYEQSQWGERARNVTKLASVIGPVARYNPPVTRTAVIGTSAHRFGCDPCPASDASGPRGNWASTIFRSVTQSDFTGGEDAFGHTVP